jgi:alpha-1,3-rhamnosyltransferase
MKKNFPLISIIIPAYNHELYVERAIVSVLNQSYENIDLVVVDDGSSDNTWDVIQNVHRKYDGKFKIFTQENKGVCKTLNFGISNSSGEYIAVLASDDYYAPNKLEKQIKTFLESPAVVGLVHSSAYLDYGGSRSLVSLTGSYLPAVGQCFYMLIEQGARVVAPTVMFKRTAYESVHGFDENLVAEDVDFYVALAARGWEFAYDPTPLVYKTVVWGSLGSNVEILHDVHFKILEKYKNNITPEKFEFLNNNIYKHIIALAAGNNQLMYAFRTSLTLSNRTHSPFPLIYFTFKAARSLILKFIPLNARHYLRQFRANLVKNKHATRV